MRRPFDLAKAADRLPALLTSMDPEKRAEAERLIAEADSYHIAIDLLKRAAETAQSQGPSFLRWWWPLWLLPQFVQFIAKRITGTSLPEGWLEGIYLVLGFMLACFSCVVSVRLMNKKPLFAVVSEWLKWDDARVFPFLMACWQPTRKAPQNTEVERALNEWITTQVLTKPEELLPQQVSQLGKQGRSLFRVVHGRGKVVRVVPKGTFSDARADWLVTLFQYLALRPDWESHEREPERKLLQWAAQMQAPTENHTFVRDAAQALLQPKPKPVSVTPVTVSFPTYSTTPPTPAITVQRRL